MKNQNLISGPLVAILLGSGIYDFLLGEKAASTSGVDNSVHYGAKVIRVPSHQ